MLLCFQLIETGENNVGGINVNPPNSFLVEQAGGDIIVKTSGYETKWDLLDEEDCKSQKVLVKGSKHYPSND